MMLGSKVPFASSYDVRIAPLLRNSRAPTVITSSQQRHRKRSETEEEEKTKAVGDRRHEYAGGKSRVYAHLLEKNRNQETGHRGAEIGKHTSELQSRI